MEAQKEAVLSYLGPGPWEVVGEYIEIEKTATQMWTELLKAISECKSKNARLIVAKLHRLSSDLDFARVLQHAKVHFGVAEVPDLDESTVHVLSALARHERRLISECAKAALAQAKRRGAQLGNPCFAEGRQIPGSGNTEPARQEKSRLASEYATRMLPVIEEIKSAGSPSLRAIATELNNRGLLTRRNKPWSATAVMRVLRTKQTGGIK